MYVCRLEVPSKLPSRTEADATRPELRTFSCYSSPFSDLFLGYMKNRSACSELEKRYRQ